MILCVVDDLIFSIKISTAAKALGMPVYFERNAGTVLTTVKAKQPTLVIFDLNSKTLRPLDAIAALKSDAALKSTRTLGYVSHVDSDTIAAARAAGSTDFTCYLVAPDRTARAWLSGDTDTRRPAVLSEALVGVIANRREVLHVAREALRGRAELEAYARSAHRDPAVTREQRAEKPRQQVGPIMNSSNRKVPKSGWRREHPECS